MSSYSASSNDVAMKEIQLILLDRDGVINVDRADYVKNVEEFKFIEGAIEGIKLLNEAQIPVAIITNQGGIGRGLYTKEDLEEIHEHMRKELAKHGAFVDKIFYCSDHPDAPSHRRKPNPGMLEEALVFFKVSPQKTHMIGDDMRDIIPAFQCNIHRHLVLTGKGEKTKQNKMLQDYAPVSIHSNLLQAAQAIIGR